MSYYYNDLSFLNYQIIKKRGLAILIILGSFFSIYTILKSPKNLGLYLLLFIDVVLVILLGFGIIISSQFII